MGGSRVTATLLPAVPAPGTAHPVGYRVWVATDTGALVSFFNGVEWPAEGWAEADCTEHAAPAPVADCKCGIHLMRDLDQALSYAQQDNAIRWNALPCVVGAVEFDGKAFPSGANEADPPSTVRVARARLVELVAFAPSAEPLRPLLREKLGPDLVPEAPSPLPPTSESPPADVCVALIRRIVARVTDPRRLRANPSRVIAEGNLANKLFARAEATTSPLERMFLSEELRTFLAVIGG